ncbi:MAG: hypothetical protein AMXMBFR75_33080 [Candidatus Hinthialibacteria bacterium]
MKTCKNLWPRLISWENLLLAAERAEKGKRRKSNVARFNLIQERELLLLQEELTAKSYRPGSYREFWVYERKPRLISAAPYKDRVVHHALCNIIEPIFDCTFICDSYACRTGKGTHAAADRYTEFSRKNRYVLKLDIRQYFPSIDHSLLYQELSKKIADMDVLWLIRLILATKGDAGLLWPSGKGIPIGNLTSQFFANVYLNCFDHWMKEEAGCRCYIRYVDDMVVLSDSKRWLHGMIPLIREQLAKLQLRIHPRKCSIFPVSEGCDFMGYRIWPDHRRLRPDNGHRFSNRLLKMAEKYFIGETDLETVSASIASWVGHASNADTWGLRGHILGGVTFSLCHSHESGNPENCSDTMDPRFCGDDE